MPDARRYAEDTTVATAKTVADISTLVSRHGARQFMQGWDDDRGMALIEFTLGSRRIRFVLPMPSRTERRFTHQTGQGRRHLLRTDSAAATAYEQAVRARWRALYLVLKAKLVAVQEGIVTLEDEFMAQTVLPSGRTVAQEAGPHITRAIETGTMPALLPAIGGGNDD